MKKPNRIASAIILSALIPTVASATPMPIGAMFAAGSSAVTSDVSGSITGGGSVEAAVVERSVGSSSVVSLGDLVVRFVGALMGDTVQSADDKVANQVARVRDAVRAAGPVLEFEHTSSVDEFVKFYAEGRGRKTMNIGVERSHDKREVAEQIFAEEGVPPRLIWLAQVESVWNGEACSHVGASGVWQFMPATGERFGLKQEEGIDERNDFEKSTRAAAKYLRILSKRYDGNWELAIGAYNCGEGNMDKAIAKAGVADFWVIAAKDLLPEETKQYVPKVLAASIVGPQFAGDENLVAQAD